MDINMKEQRKQERKYWKFLNKIAMEFIIEHKTFDQIAKNNDIKKDKVKKTIYMFMGAHSFSREEITNLKKTNEVLHETAHLTWLKILETLYNPNNSIKT